MPIEVGDEVLIADNHFTLKALSYPRVKQALKRWHRGTMVSMESFYESMKGWQGKVVRLERIEGFPFCFVKVFPLGVFAVHVFDLDRVEKNPKLKDDLRIGGV